MSNPLDLVNLTSLMEMSLGRPEVVIGLIDGPIHLDVFGSAKKRVLDIPGRPGACEQANSAACKHGTLVASILFADRGYEVPAICPGCSLLVRPIFNESAGSGRMPIATPGELTMAVIDCVNEGVNVINMSVNITNPSLKDKQVIRDALDFAAKHGVIIVAASGNQGMVGGTVITNHPWVIPVAACNLKGMIISQSNISSSIGRRGLCAPGCSINSIGPDGVRQTFSGTSAAAPFVTGAIGLLWSVFPKASAIDLKRSLLQSAFSHGNTVVPRLLDAGNAYQAMTQLYMINHVE